MNALRQLLDAVAAGRISVDQAVRDCQQAATETIRGATLDLGRTARCGFGEAVYGSGKPAGLVEQIAVRLLQHQPEVLVTRCPPEVAEAVGPRFAQHRYAPRAQTLRLSHRDIAPPGPAMAAPETAGSETAGSETAGARTAGAAAGSGAGQPRVVGPVPVVTAGSTDAAVAEEAAETLAWMGVAVDWIEDVGVAGPQRILGVLDRLRSAPAIVVVAGMEGALPSVVAGHVACPVIAVPTSVGYGAALSGMTPLLAMLTSCVANVAVVNIDAGFKGGYLAGMIATAVDAAAARS